MEGWLYIYRLVESCLEETVARYLAAMLTHIKVVDEELLELMQRDKDTIIAAFEEHIRPDKVMKVLSDPCNHSNFAFVVWHVPRHSWITFVRKQACCRPGDFPKHWRTSETWQHQTMLTHLSFLTPPCCRYTAHIHFAKCTESKLSVRA